MLPRCVAILLAGVALVRPAEAQIMSLDIGHEFFKVALMRQGVPLEIVLNSHSKRKTPTAVSFFEAVRAFGDDALAHQGKSPSKVPQFFHWMMGRNFTSVKDVTAEGEWWKTFGLGNKFYAYNLGYDEDRGVPTFEFTTENSTYSEEVLANIIQFAKGMAEESADGKSVRDLVVTIPSNANLRQRQAIAAAGEIAGCRVLTLVHEGSAFAVQRAVDFQPEKGSSEMVMFYNMGSRKTEVSIAKFESKQAGMVAGKTAPVVTVVGSAIDYDVGGHLMDLKIAEVMLKRFQEKNPSLANGIVKNPRALRKLLSQAQKTKAILSANKNAPFIVESLFEDVDFQASIHRTEFEEMCSEMLARLTVPIEEALAVANLTAADITQVELIGGAWRVPKVQQVLGEYFESKQQKKMQLGQHLNGEEGGAMGAALVGANSSSSFRVKKIFFADITMHEYAVQVASLTGAWEKNFTVLYPVGAHLGGKKKLAFSMEEDFEIRLFEDGVLISVYSVTGLQDLLKEKWSAYNLTGLPKISVSVPLETSGIIEIKSPTATVEEVYWVNVTKELPKATNATANETNATDSKTDSEKDDAESEANASTAQSENGTEVVWKQKKKKHEKKLAVKRVDFKPAPLSQEGIAASKGKLADMAKREEEVARVTALKNELEAGIYTSRDKMEREDILKVSTDEQREEVSKLCMEYEEWMYESSTEKNDYEQRLNKLKDLLGPMEERALEMEARADLPDNVKELVADAKAMKAHIAKNMSWVNENKTADAAKKLSEFEEWWAKKQEKQAALPLYEAPAFTRNEVMEKINAVYKDFDKLKKTKKPKEKKPKENKTAKANTSAKAGSQKAQAKAEDVMPVDIETTEKELAWVQGEKAAAVEKEDYDKAHSLKSLEKKLNEHLAKLKAEKSEL